MTRTSQRLTLLWLALFASALSPADTLFLRAGEQEPGKLLEITRDTVRFEGRNGVLELAKADVQKIQLQRARQFDGVDTVAQVEDPTLKRCIESQPAAEDFPGAGTATLYRRVVYDLTEPGVVRETARTITKVLQQRGEDAGTTYIYYFEDTDTPDIDFALTVTPDGRVLHLSDAAIENESVYAELPDYRRLSRYRFACKEPRPGSILDVQYTVVRKRGGLLEPFFERETFRGDAPLLHKQVVVRVPESGESGLAWQLLGPDAIESSREVKDGVAELAWTLREVQTGVVPEPNMPPYADFAPMLVVGETASWEELGQAYAAELAKLPALPQELADKAVALDAENGPRAIHDFIARNIRTIGVGQREYRLLPHAPEETLRRGMANELDTNFLYFKMLEAADIPCRFALVCGRNTGPLAEDVASLWAFDRSAVYLEKDDCFSTVSGDVQPFGVLSGAMQDAPALIADRTNGMLTATQQPRPEDELVATGFDASLDAKGNLTIAVTYRGTGNSEGWIRNLKDLDDQQLRNTLQQFAVSLHPAAALASYETTDLADLRVPPVLTLRCTIAGYAAKAGEDLMLFNIPAVDYSAGDVGRPDRTLGLFWGHVCREAASGTIRLPAGYRVYSMPETVALDTPTASYSASIAEAEGTLRFQDAYDLKVSNASPEAYRDYKASKELRASVPRQRIILTR